ncbi:hypothetical protein HAZT_HAZT008931 [Hyalella azteca]|uniref:Uncharacterized protein n=1 Tax=Hyalella azteca TaxID=294128 RepID=A0A6A0H4C3_HYAAZ|nr:hypothetical protein HAZT_HAZT008931 [Hyalella azteca]
MAGTLSSASESRYTLLDMNIEQETLRELTQRKSAMLMELKNYQENQRISNSTSSTGAVAGTGLGNSEGVAVIPVSSVNYYGDSMAHVFLILIFAYNSCTWCGKTA